MQERRSRTPSAFHWHAPVIPAGCALLFARSVNPMRVQAASGWPIYAPLLFAGKPLRTELAQEPVPVRAGKEQRQLGAAVGMLLFQHLSQGAHLAEQTVTAKGDQQFHRTMGALQLRCNGIHELIHAFSSLGG